MAEAPRSLSQEMGLTPDESRAVLRAEISSELSAVLVLVDARTPTIRI